MRQLDDAALTASAQQGDRKALEELIRRHEAQVFRFGQRMCRNPEDAEDVLQETFLAMTRTLDGFRGASSVSTWLYTIARSFCIKKRRRSKFAPTHVESLDREEGEAARQVADAGRPPDEEVAGAQLKRVLDDAIAGLKPMYREVLVLRDIEGLTAPEVGKVLGLTIQAVKSRLHRAREMVREHVTPALQSEDLPPPTGHECQNTARLFSQHLEGEIDASTCASMEQHIASCPHCGALCSSLRQTLSACQDLADQRSGVPLELQRAVREAVRGFVENRVQLTTK
ncbi:MAG: sigma-70 family RNA polymerase sigma factor [Pseudomonadota bacterium]